jgi:hypothetical protein
MGNKIALLCLESWLKKSNQVKYNFHSKTNFNEGPNSGIQKLFFALTPFQNILNFPQPFISTNCN